MTAPPIDDAVERALRILNMLDPLGALPTRSGEDEPLPARAGVVPPLLRLLPPSLVGIFDPLDALKLSDASTPEQLQGALRAVAERTRASSFDDFERAFIRSRAHEIVHCHSPELAEELVYEAFGERIEPDGSAYDVESAFVPLDGVTRSHPRADVEAAAREVVARAIKLAEPARLYVKAVLPARLAFLMLDAPAQERKELVGEMFAAVAVSR